MLLKRHEMFLQYITPTQNNNINNAYNKEIKTIWDSYILDCKTVGFFLKISKEIVGLLART